MKPETVAMIAAIFFSVYLAMATTGHLDEKHEMCVTLKKAIIAYENPSPQSLQSLKTNELSQQEQEIKELLKRAVYEEYDRSCYGW